MGRGRQTDSGQQCVICQATLAFGSYGTRCCISAKSVSTAKRETEKMRTIILLTVSNIFMTFAWYGHLKFRSTALWKVILISWGIAFFEYCFQVPANRIGSYEFTAAQLKTIQEVITLTVFSVFSVLYLGEKIKWNYAAGFCCIALAVFFVFHKW